MRVFLDPGHGGSNPGCAHGGLQEKNYTLEIANLTAAALTAAGHTVTQSRTSDTTMSFVQRATLAEIAKSQCVFVLHVNANPDPKPSGLRVYVMPEEPCLVPESLQLAQDVLANTPATLARKGRVPEIASLDGEGDDVVLRHYDCPAVLVEMGFATNANDLVFLLSAEGKQAIATCLVRAVDAWERARE